jgi:RHS repeat-associated protein
MYFDNAPERIAREEKFSSFGESLYERGVSNYIPFRLYGMYKDTETGLYYNVRRYYDWRIGRYLQPDPVSDLNLYVYVNNSPYDAVDPLGMFETAIKIRAEVYLGPITYVYRHVGAPKHEEITEEAIKALGYPKLSQYGFRIDDW